MTSVRAQEVDAIRGVALFGICVVNLPFLSLPAEKLLMPPLALQDKITNFAVELLFQGKFFVLFSFLFGWSFGTQLKSAERRRQVPRAAYMRRLLGLLLLGVAHAVLVFYGDILVLYAILGLALWTTRDWPPRKLLRMSAALIALAFVCLLLLAGVMGEETAALAEMSPAPSGYLGTFADAVCQRITDWGGAFVFIALFNGPIALAAFCAGLAAYRARFFERGSESYHEFKRNLKFLMLPAIVCNLSYAAAVSGLLGQSVPAAVGFALLAIGGPALGALYLFGIVELVRSGFFSEPATSVGRMSLTAYVGEGLVAGFIFNGYGLAQFGALGSLELFGLAVAVFLIVHVLCALWLKFNPMGPLEIMLRWITRGSPARA